MRIRWLLWALSLSLSMAARATEPDATTHKEIVYLMDHLASSGCQFNRNGTWYDAARAVNHLKRKHEYLLKKGLVSDTDAFIKLAASESSATGKPYLVKCGNQREVPSAVWFRAALVKFRAESPSGAQ